MGACYIQHFQYDFRILYLDQASRVSLYKNKETKKLKFTETLIMIKYQIIEMKKEEKKDETSNEQQ